MTYIYLEQLLDPDFDFHRWKDEMICIVANMENALDIETLMHLPPLWEYIVIPEDSVCADLQTWMQTCSQKIRTSSNYLDTRNSTVGPRPTSF